MISRFLTSDICSIKIILPLVFLSLSLSLSGQVQPVADTLGVGGDGFHCRDGRLWKVAGGKETCSFSAGLRGGITSFDTLNPFKILVFSAPFQKIYYLDNRLVPLSQEFALSDLGLGEVTCVCASKYGGFWAFDRWSGTLVRFDSQAQRVSASDAFSLLGLSGFIPSGMREYGDRIWLFDPVAGCCVFDLFGNYITTYPKMRPEDLDAF